MILTTPRAHTFEGTLVDQAVTKHGVSDPVVATASVAKLVSLCSAHWVRNGHASNSASRSTDANDARRPGSFAHLTCSGLSRILGF